MEIEMNNLTELVEKEIAAAVVYHEPFTAYDITQSLRPMLKTNIQHAEVRDIVRDLMCEGSAILVNNSYILSSCWCESKKCHICVYHYDQFDPMEYIEEINELHAKTTMHPENLSQKIERLEQEKYDLEYEFAQYMNITSSNIKSSSNSINSQREPKNTLCQH